MNEETKRKIGNANRHRILKPDAIIHQTQQCLNCKKEFKRTKIRMFCSNRCSASFKYKNSKLEKKCNFCHKQFLIPLHRKETFKYCSMRCYGNAMLGRVPFNKGIKRPEFSGINHPRWKDIKYPRYIHTTGTLEYKQWRTAVFSRDNYKCKIGKVDCDNKLQAHHILNWVDYPELRYEVNNGITLCRAHHPRKRAEEKRLVPYFMGLATVSNLQQLL